MSRAMLRIGLTGNVGAGKSSVAEIWRTERGARIIDADALGREAVEPGRPALGKLVEKFGGRVLNPDGSLNRRETGRIAFSDRENLLALNRIVHPHILDRIDSLTEQAGREGERVCVVDAALIYEFGLDKRLDFVVTVDAPLETRKARVLGKGRMDEQTLEMVMRVQLPAEELSRRADHVIRNDSDLEALRERALEVFDSIAARREFP